MSGFLYGISLQWKLDLRNKMALLTYYIVPILFFIFMSGIFTSTNPEAYKTLIQSMTVFSVSMGAIVGSPIPIVEMFSSDIKKSYQVGRIPLWTAVVNNFISTFIHLFIVSIVIFFIAQFAFDAVSPTNVFIYFISLAIFLGTSIALGSVLGLLVKNEAKLTMISQVIFLPSIMLSGIMFPVEMLPKALESVGMIFPATWGFKTMVSDGFDIKLILPLILMFIVCVVITVLKLRSYNVNKSKRS